ncbi:hypothetical protein DYB37_005115 [Aphanomyces astaci]|uniref:Exportin-1/Importin-beta-like domain-containing protein n=1 Tax=Aphanomyces astaci TaxID=112090 RepID=A0A397AFM2_APHAT|nr:hypothetical protein DYB36_006259 [Aphanomyces astaci]RHY41613.1 hypothetical protein DYB34_012688 [Aphanomyces astaci]RHY59319.1 hypothetical protein DYB38_004977 [Aphanomyces astaci]RHZ17936.1 hypothetical protein DYB37_005115 [Aphanomyces astaci]RHZ18971.1 hypothetical protein DYB31_012700 [Aphanomyces astaci]
MQVGVVRPNVPAKWTWHFLTHALTSLRQFIDTCHPEMVEPYLESLLGSLFALLNLGHATAESRSVQEYAVSALSSIAGCCGESFGRFFNMVFPPLKQLLYTSLQELQLDAASTTTAPVGLAVGPAVFGGDAAEILDVMTQMQHSSQYANDEILRSYLLQAWARWCKTLTHHFANYLPVVMPSLLDAAMVCSSTY